MINGTFLDDYDASSHFFVNFTKISSLLFGRVKSCGLHERKKKSFKGSRIGQATTSILLGELMTNTQKLRREARLEQGSKSERKMKVKVLESNQVQL